MGNSAAHQFTAKPPIGSNACGQQQQLVADSVTLASGLACLMHRWDQLLHAHAAAEIRCTSDTDNDA